MGVSVRLTAIDVSDFALPASRRSVLVRGTHAPRAHPVVADCYTQRRSAAAPRTSSSKPIQEAVGRQ